MDHQNGESLKKRMAVYAVGMLVYTYGVCLMTRAHMGISPVTSVAYILTLILPLTLGTTQFIVNLLMVGLQILWLGKKFPRVQYLQLAASLLFSVFIDCMMPFTAGVDALEKGVLARLAVFLAAMLIMGISLAVVAMSRMVLLPADGFGNVMAQQLHVSFGKAKIINDCSCVTVTLVLSFLFLHRLEAISSGTIIAAVGLGYLVKTFTKWLQPLYKEIVSNQGRR